MTTGKESRGVGRSAYVLVMLCATRRKLPVGSLGRLAVAPGYYLYVGSGGANVLRRVERHLRPQKVRRWQVDWLTSGPNRLRPAEACILPVLQECEVASFLGQAAEPVHRLGASDCRCSTHLFYSRDAAPVRRVLLKLSGLSG